MVPRSRHCGSLGELVSMQNAGNSFRIHGDPCEISSFLVRSICVEHLKMLVCGDVYVKKAKM